MTGPLGGASLGDAYVEVHARTDEFPGDVEKGLNKAGKEAERDADKVGKDLGDHIGTGVEKEVGKHGPSVARSLGRAIEKETISVMPSLRYNVRGKDGRFIARTAANIREEVEDAFSDATAGAGGVFGKIGQAIADAIGAGFNVSGKSPLVYILAPVYAAIAGLVIAAIQAANGVVAALLAIPAAISVVAVEVGVLVLAFHGVGDAIKGAFAATNADELNAALKNLTPSAQSFVKALLPAKGLFHDLSVLAQESFFAAFGGGARVTAFLDAINKPLRQGIPIVAAALGRFLEQLTAFFASPIFTGFLDVIFPAVANIIQMLSGPFINLLISLFVLIVQTLPFLGQLTARFGDLLNNIGDLLSSVSPQWLDEMLGTLDKTFDLLGAVLKLVAVIFSQVNAAGGADLIVFLTDAVTVLANFLASDIGREGIKGIILLAEAGIFIVLALIEALILLAAGFQWVADQIWAFVQWLYFVVWPSIRDFFTGSGDDAHEYFGRVAAAFTGIGTTIQTFIGTALANMRTAFRTAVDDAVGLLRSLPTRIVDAIGNLGGLLRNAGRTLIQGFIDGIKDRLPNVSSILGVFTNTLPNLKGPEDKDRKILKPAGEAVMEGFGTGLQSGAMDIRKLLGDFTADLGVVGSGGGATSIMFGAGALQVNFKGALPTSDQAYATGQAVGAGLSSQLAARNTRLAVRTL